MAKKRKPKKQEREDVEPVMKVTVNDSGVTEVVDPKYKRIYVTVNAFAFAVNQAELRFKSLESLLMEYHSAEIKKKPLDPHTFSTDMGYEKRNDIVALAWDIIDWMERSRKIFGVITGIPKKNDFYSAIMKSLEPAERFRQVLQHYDSEVIKPAVTGMYPVMGAIIATFRSGNSWGGRILLSTPARFTGDNEVCVAGARFIENNMRGDVDGITLSITNHAVNLSKIWYELELEKEKLSVYLEQTLRYPWPKL
jgi:hypothetical protein